jgi:rhodanese-related sulfurtransferase/DNA-binding transcriptional ArsR family regulator
MSDRDAKDALFSEFAVIGKAMANAGRLELLDLLAQGPRSVDALAAAADMGVSTCSAHLHTLREAGLVTSSRNGKRIVNALTHDDVAELLRHLQDVAQNYRPSTEVARRAFLGPDDVEVVNREELLTRVHAGQVVVLDVRPDVEYAAGHLPGALHIPLAQLANRLDELPGDVEIVAYCRGAYCVMSVDAVQFLNDSGYKARRASEGALEWRAAGLLRTEDAA